MESKSLYISGISFLSMEIKFEDLEANDLASASELLKNSSKEPVLSFPFLMSSKHCKSHPLKITDK